ncbi:hypothetical protein [Hymenobacter arizonensis]|uniref:TonB family C-terminal domain-containing protein n=1 Tax=Hymenobacter arizonensis TaxID=1227077 RepID=A0A1I5V6F6_HYMAR|nr:hypothetical protein [Hymenobacter arizonensis]SFQ03085.1 hypothetical protein SAMN04515668_1218 [Hymenobacter arizonensis]
MSRLTGVFGLLIWLLPHFGWATAQAPDLLVYHGDTLRLHSNPLESWLEKLPARPTELNFSTACWRGYEATWLLEDDQLFLLNVTVCGEKPRSVIDLRRWFTLDRQGRVPAVWVSGNLDVVLGELLRYEQMGYASIYQKDWLLTFEVGRLVKQQTFDNTACQEAGPPGGGAEFFNRLHQSIKWASVPKQKASAQKRVFVQFTPDSTGRSCSVVLVKSCGLPYDSLALAAARIVAATDWGACYRFGRWQSFAWIAPVVFTEKNRRRNWAIRPAGVR